MKKRILHRQDIIINYNNDENHLINDFDDLCDLLRGKNMIYQFGGHDEIYLHESGYNYLLSENVIYPDDVRMKKLKEEEEMEELKTLRQLQEKYKDRI